MGENFEKNCKWYFPDHQGSDAGPNEPMRENFKKNRYASLIREAIQNSLDAVNDAGRPVTVSFQFKKMPKEKFPNFFELESHIAGCLTYYKDNENAKEIYKPMSEYLKAFLKSDEPFPYLSISDYNTKGMEYKAGDTNCPFYAFVLSAGVTSKGRSSAGGSFGFGKAAYFAISQISTLFVSTRTLNGDCFFEGISSLCTHEMDGRRKTAVGFYNDKEEERPIEGKDNIPYRFLRKEDEGTGTDIHIMGVDISKQEELVKEMKEAVLRNFWLSIYRKKLIVKIDKEEITSENIAGVIEKSFPGLIDTNNRATYNPRPYFDAVRFANRESHCRLFEKSLPQLGKVYFYTLTDKNATDRISYMRAPLMLVYPKKYQTNYGFYGVFVCEDKKGNELLRKMENPAHNEWNEKNWINGGKTDPIAKEVVKELEGFIKDCVNELFKTSHSERLKINGLEDYLYIPTSLENDEESIIGDAGIEEAENETPVSIQSKLSSKATKGAEQKNSVGKVLLEKRTNATASPDGQLYSGHSNKVSRTKGGGAGSRNLTMSNVPDEKGKMGTYAEAVSVKYRTFSQKKNGEILHYIIIHSDKEIENGKISLLVAGEQEDDKIKIVRSSKGKPYQNILSKLHFMPGRNEIVVKLDDEMKHALKLDIYEYK